MERVIVDLHDYPKFIDEWLYSTISIEAHLRNYGIHSAEKLLSIKPTLSIKYSMYEGDRIWFIMRWS